jgi:steroid 5-alpha reductase family enzyme
LIALRNELSIGVLTYIGIVLFALGSIFETGGELQRIWFKKIKANAGKPFTGGLFSISQHVNYFGYTLWRAGMALISGSLIWTFLLVLFITYDFFTGGIPDLQKHNRERYGKEYEIYSAKTAKFVPFVY